MSVVQNFNDMLLLVILYQISQRI